MRNDRRALQLLLAAALGVHAATAGGDLRAGVTATRLRCEYRVDPCGIDVARPRLSWELRATRRAEVQTAYHILVASSLAALQGNTGDLWDSGKVRSDRAAHVGYAGSALQSRARCFWKVRVWDRDGAASPWSRPGRWSMGLLAPGDWKAIWIGAPKPQSAGGDGSSPWFRKVVSLDEKPVRAVAYAACMGYQELHINGRKVGDDVLSPAVSDYSKRAYYVTHDVTPLLHKGENCIGLWLGSGWYVKGLPGVVHDGPIARVQVEITLPGGRTTVVATDTTWKTRPSSVTALRTPRGSPFNYGGGERLDARKHLAGWSLPRLDDSGWAHAAAVQPAPAKLCAQMVQPNRLTRTIRPVLVEKLGPGEYLLDMGRNATGWFELRLRAPAGKTVHLQYTELRRLDEERAKYPQFDECIPAADGETLFRNRFNYHSFRWVRIRGLSRPPTREDASLRLVETAMERTGGFSCSNELLNRIYRTVVWTYRCLDLGGYMVDCPHRERLGYGGDGQVTMETGLYTFDAGAFYTKWLGNWRDAQDPSTGELPNIAPPWHSAGGGPTWGAISILLPWQLHLHYGDRKVLQECYPMMQRYVKFLDSKSRDHILEPYGHPNYGFIGDWVAPGRDQRIGPWSDEELRVFFNNCFCLYLNQLMGKISAVLDKPREAATYREKSRAIAAAVQRRFFKPESNSYVNGEQPYLAFALLTGLVPPSRRAAVLANLENEIAVKNKGHLNSGMHGTYFLIKCLNREGRDDLTHRIASRRTYPGWGYMLEQGATTIWERWDGHFSRIHSTLLSIGSWFPAGICGIQPDEEHPGFRRAILRPRIVGGLTWARASYDTIRGRFGCAWRAVGGALDLKVSVPANATAAVHIPVRSAAEVTEGGRPAGDAEGVRLLSRSAGEIVFEVGSGSYHFRAPLAEVTR